MPLVEALHAVVTGRDAQMMIEIWAELEQLWLFRQSSAYRVVLEHRHWCQPLKNHRKDFRK